MHIRFFATSHTERISEPGTSTNKVGQTTDSQIFGYQASNVPSVKNSGISMVSTILNFFNYKSGEQTPSLLSQNDNIKSIPSPRTQETIKNEQSLFSIRDFQKIASTRIFNLFGRPYSHDPGRRQLFKELQEYHNLNPHDLNARCQKLVQLEKTTCDYLDTKNREIHDSSLLSYLFFNKSDLRKDSEAAQYFLQGIALEKQKNLVAASSCTITNVQRGNDLKPSTVSGDMATIEVVNYVAENSTTPKTGYFKPVGNDEMKSIVGERMGIPVLSTAAANLSGRAVAVYEISKLLGFALVPETFFATCDGDVGSLQEEAQGQHLIQEERQPYRFSKSEMNARTQDILSGNRLIKTEDQSYISFQESDNQKFKLKSTQQQGSSFCEVVIVNNNNEDIKGQDLQKLLSRDPPQVIVQDALIKKILKEEIDEKILGIIDGTSSFNTNDLLLTDVLLCFKDNKLFKDDQIVEKSQIPQLLTENKIQLTKKIVTAVSDVNFNDPVLQNELLDAQVLDFLTGQLDRHANNFIYSQDNSKNWHVQLIDNDLSFPEKFTSVKDLDCRELGRTPVLKALPPILSKKTALSIENLTKENVTSVLRASGLSTQEIDATQSRLVDLKNHVTSLRENNNVNDEWEANIVSQKEDKTYCYWGHKDQQLAQESLKANQELI